MDESLARAIDGTCKIIVTIGLIVGGVWTLFTYFNARAAEAKTASIEAKKPFLAKRLEVYSNIVDLSSKIAFERWKIHKTETFRLNDASGVLPAELRGLDVTTLRNELQQDYSRFQELNFGSMALVQDGSVEEAAANFRSCYHQDQCDDKDLVLRAVAIAEGCSNSIKTGWDVDVSSGGQTRQELERLRN